MKVTINVRSVGVATKWDTYGHIKVHSLVSYVYNNPTRVKTSIDTKWQIRNFTKSKITQFLMQSDFLIDVEVAIKVYQSRLKEPRTICEPNARGNRGTHYVRQW